MLAAWQTYVLDRHTAVCYAWMQSFCHSFTARQYGCLALIWVLSLLSRNYAGGGGFFVILLFYQFLRRNDHG